MGDVFSSNRKHVCSIQIHRETPSSLSKEGTVFWFQVSLQTMSRERKRNLKNHFIAKLRTSYITHLLQSVFLQGVLRHSF